MAGGQLGATGCRVPHRVEWDINQGEDVAPILPHNTAEINVLGMVLKSILVLTELVQVLLVFLTRLTLPACSDYMEK